MRVLFISNFFPPLHRGGYEEWCQEIALRFLDAGHPVRVLTSRYQADQNPNDPPYVYRQLNLEMEIASLSNGLKFFTHRKKRIRQSIKTLENHISEFNPDAILCWGMWNFPFEIPAAAEHLLPGKVGYYLGDYWPTLPPQFKNYWEAEPSGSLTALPKKILAIPATMILNRETRPELKLEHGFFCSQYMLQEMKAQGVNFSNSHLVYGAIDTRPYAQSLANGGPKRAEGTLQLLSVGRLIDDKGHLTILKALKILVDRYGCEHFHLKVVGDGPPEYLALLHSYSAQENLDKFVTFAGSVPKSDIPQIFNESDIFVFASKWPEPFGRVIVEAMASGVAVVAAEVGGAAEIVENEYNALTFNADDAHTLASHLNTLIGDAAIRQTLIENGYTSAQKFDVDRMAAELITALLSLQID